MNLVNQVKKTFALTTPLYYVNDVPHIGSAYTTIAADAVARFQKLLGREVLLITGTDEHGQKIQRSAESLGKAPQEFCDSVVPSFMSLWELLNIRYLGCPSPRHCQRIFCTGMGRWRHLPRAAKRLVLCIL